MPLIPRLLPFFLTLLILSGCNASREQSKLPPRELPAGFADYWFQGEAEITSYELEQYRYGEPRKGTAVLVFVTEHFLPEVQVKANGKRDFTVPVIKLNATKKFVTGIYPYSIMESTFYPLEGDEHAIKLSASVQEWCGQVYMQLNNKKSFAIRSHSYFKGEADQFIDLSKTHLENEVWTQLRIDPEKLPLGSIEMLPSLEYIRLAHIDIKAYEANAEFYRDGDLSVYRIVYPELQRTLKIYYHNRFPFKIEKWEETIKKNGESFTSTAKKMNEIKTDYWNKNSNKHLPLRDTLNLD